MTLAQIILFSKPESAFNMEAEGKGNVVWVKVVKARAGSDTAGLVTHDRSLLKRFLE